MGSAQGFSPSVGLWRSLTMQEPRGVPGLSQATAHPGQPGPGVGRRAVDFVQGKRRQAPLDKAYDTDNVLDYFESRKITPVIPPKANRVVQREYDQELYKERNLIERFIGKIKQFRRVFSRFDKYARTYLHFIHFACVLISIR